MTVPKHLTHGSEPSAFSVAVPYVLGNPPTRHHGSRGSWLSRSDCSRAAEMPPNVDKDHTGVLLARHTLKIKEEASCFLFCFQLSLPRLICLEKNYGSAVSFQGKTVLSVDQRPH